MKLIMTLVFAGLAGPVLAHPGHIIDLAGHNHWLAVAAIAAAAAAALWQAKKGRDAEVEEAEEETESEPQEA
ncbi:DUF6732 family protein [Profundibacter sp.]